MIINNNLINRCLNWAGKTLHAPEQRILIGATGLAIQPFIDLNNKNVDKETRKTSAWRTAAKIIAGTIVGVAVRYWGIAFVKKFEKKIKFYDGQTYRKFLFINFYVFITFFQKLFQTNPVCSFELDRVFTKKIILLSTVIC